MFNEFKKMVDICGDDVTLDRRSNGIYRLTLEDFEGSDEHWHEVEREYDNEEAEINKIDADNFDFDGTVLLDDIAEVLNIDMPEDADYDTLGGLIMDILGRIPEENEHPVIVYNNVEFTVVLVEEHRIAKVHAKKLPKPEPDEEE